MMTLQSSTDSLCFRSASRSRPRRERPFVTAHCATPFGGKQQACATEDLLQQLGSPSLVRQPCVAPPPAVGRLRGAPRQLSNAASSSPCTGLPARISLARHWSAAPQQQPRCRNAGRPWEGQGPLVCLLPPPRNSGGPWTGLPPRWKGVPCRTHAMGPEVLFECPALCSISHPGVKCVGTGLDGCQPAENHIIAACALH